MFNNKDTVFWNGVCVMIVLLSGILRLVYYSYSGISLTGITCILYITAIFIWIYQMKRRLIKPQEQKYLIQIGHMLCFLILLRTVKFAFLPSSVWTRYAWYLYYIPFIYIILFLLSAVLQIGKNTGRSQSINGLYAIAALLSAAVLTNDLHQTAFRFPVPVSDWQDADGYTYGILYYLIIAWITVLSIVILGITLHRRSSSDNRKQIWKPLLPLGIGICYMLLYRFHPDCYFVSMYKMAEMIIIIFPAFMEGLIQAHLFPVNDHYMELWNACSLNGGILSEDGEMLYTAGSTRHFTAAEVRHAVNDEVLLQNGNILLRSYPVHGGYGYWMKDISQIREVNKKLTELGNILEEENAMLEGENRLAQQREQIRQKTALYDTIMNRLHTELLLVNYLLDTVPDEEDAFIHQMQYAAIINAYIKRYSNMLLLIEEHTILDSTELSLAIQETASYLTLYGIQIYYETDGTMQLSGEKILTSYAVLEYVIEEAIHTCHAMFLTLSFHKDMQMYIEMDCVPSVTDFSRWKNAIEQYKGMLTVCTEEQTLYLRLVLPGEEGITDVL